MTQVTEADRGYTAEDMVAAELLWNDLPVFPTNWHTMPPHMKALVCRVIARHREQAVQEAVAELKPWRDAIDDALVCAHLGTADSFPDAKTALHKLICWEIDVALDPRVSDRARDLMAERDARIEALEAHIEGLNAIVESAQISRLKRIKAAPVILEIANDG